MNIKLHIKMWWIIVYFLLSFSFTPQRLLSTDKRATFMCVIDISKGLKKCIARYSTKCLLSFIWWWLWLHIHPRYFWNWLWFLFAHTSNQFTFTFIIELKSKLFSFGPDFPSHSIRLNVWHSCKFKKKKKWKR